MRVCNKTLRHTAWSGTRMAVTAKLQYSLPSGHKGISEAMHKEWYGMHMNHIDMICYQR